MRSRLLVVALLATLALPAGARKKPKRKPEDPYARSHYLSHAQGEPSRYLFHQASQSQHRVGGDKHPARETTKKRGPRPSGSSYIAPMEQPPHHYHFDAQGRPLGVEKPRRAGRRAPKGTVAPAPAAGAFPAPRKQLRKLGSMTGAQRGVGGAGRFPPMRPPAAAGGAAPNAAPGGDAMTP